MRISSRWVTAALVSVLALSLTACDEDEPTVVDPASGEVVDGAVVNKSGKPPTVKMKAATVTVGEDYGFTASDVSEIHVQLDSGKVIVCLLNSYYNTIDTCDWEHPLKEAPPR